MMSVSYESQASIFSWSSFVRTRGAGVLAGASLAAAAFLLGAPAHAQVAGADVWSQSGCSRCHGNLAEGGGGGAEPAGPNLRTTRLDRDQIVEVITCGRPGTEMPYNVRGAYTEVACYGLPVGEVPDGMGGAGLITVEEVEALADFLMEYVVGERRITRENCAVFYGGNPNSPRCLQY